ncbi:MAG: hypothetical protein GY943_22605 [Chloroflexi bacterium]|nr:hypothetical protein [Chloroflexota bacterium]
MSALNPGELSSDTSLIEATSSDMWNKEYQDLLIGEILSPLIYYGDQQDPPNVYEIGVYENQQLYYRPRGSNGRTWHVDVPEKELSKTISTMYNEAYATHGSGDLKRTAVAQIDASVDKYGLKRRVFVSTTTSQANAERRRDTTLEEFQIATPQGDVVIERLQDESGTAYPIWMIRAGDTIHIRNTSITDGDEIDRTSTFTVKRVAYQLLANTVSVTPESDLPYIEYLAPKF